MFQTMIDKLLHSLYPKRCPFCSSLIDKAETICSECAQTIKPKCLVRSIQRERFVYCVSPFHYSGVARQAILRFKFYGHKDSAHAFSLFMCKALSESCPSLPFDIVTSVPSSFIKRRERGYNQAEVIGKEIAQLLGLPHDRLLKKSKRNLEQHTLLPHERMENVAGVYSPTNPHKIANKRILLCDDVVTSGSTMKECSRVLYHCGAKYVLCTAIADSQG